MKTLTINKIIEFKVERVTWLNGKEIFSFFDEQGEWHCAENNTQTPLLKNKKYKGIFDKKERIELVEIINE